MGISQRSITTMNSLLHLVLTLLLTSATFALELNAVNPDAVTVGESPSTNACRSAHLQQPDGSCSPNPTCASQYFLTNVKQLETEAPTSLEPGRVVGTNALEIVVQHASVLDRLVTKIELSADEPLCNYPGPHWTKGLQTNWAATESGADVCRDTYTSNIPWSIDCGLIRSENTTHVTFTGHGTVFYEDSLGELDGIALGARQVSSVVRFELSQPKVIRDISTSIQIFDEPRLLGAVTRQLFDFQSGTATLSVVLSMAAPLRTLAVSSLTAPTGISIAPLGIADNALCADNRTLTCQQTYSFELDPQELCQLDGDYALQFSVGCHPSIVGTPLCPATMTQAPLSITVTLDSEDFCTIVQGLLSVDGSITSHGEFDASTFAFGPLKTAFFQDQTLQFQVTANSLNGFPFAESSLLLVEAEDKAGVRQTLYDSEAGGAAPGWELTILPDPSNSNAGLVTHRHQFQYIAAPGVFGDVERSQPINSTIVVAVRVTFDNPVGPNAGADRRRRAPIVVTREHRLAPRQVMSNVRAAEASAAFVVEAAENPTIAETVSAVELDSNAVDIDFEESSGVRNFVSIALASIAMAFFAAL